jgi:hypothetical protein
MISSLVCRYEYCGVDSHIALNYNQILAVDTLKFFKLIRGCARYGDDMRKERPK